MSEAIYVEPDDRYEIIEGVKCMAAAAAYDHNIVAGKLFSFFDNYFCKNKIGMVVQNADVCLSEGNTFLPDLSVVCDVDLCLPDGNIFRPDILVTTDFSMIGADEKIHGVPDLCVEILSRSTMKNDIFKKKRIYAANGVREYWIVDRWSEKIEVYHLINGEYDLDDIYQNYSLTELDALNETERAEVKFDIKVSVVPELIVDVRDVFKTWWNVH